MWRCHYFFDKLSVVSVTFVYHLYQGEMSEMSDRWNQSVVCIAIMPRKYSSFSLPTKDIIGIQVWSFQTILQYLETHR